MDKEGIFVYSDSVLAKTPFGEIDIVIRSINTDDLQKLRDIIIDFYEGLATMCQNMGDECSTYGFYAEDREKQSNQIDCSHYLEELKICELYGGKCDHTNLEDCAMYELDEGYPF